MALLVYSDKCKFSSQIIEFIKTQPSLNEIVRYHNISTLGVPSKKITMVPTLVTNEGVMKVGGDIKPWLESMIPFEFESWDPSYWAHFVLKNQFIFLCFRKSLKNALFKHK